MPILIADKPPVFENSLKIISILISLENSRHKNGYWMKKWTDINKNELILRNIFENWSVAEI